MVGDGPIRISEHEWVLVRNNPRVPKAIIRRIDPGGPHEHYRVVTFALRSEDRQLLGRYRTLDAANDSVLYDATKSVMSHARGDYLIATPQPERGIR